MNQEGHPVLRSLALGFVLLGSTLLLRAQDDIPLTPYGTALLDYKSGKYDDARKAIDEAEKSSRSAS
jgi:hypothetical protein